MWWAVWCAVAGAAIVSGYFGIRWFTFRISHSITDDAFVEAHIVNVAPEMVSGRLVRFLAQENDRVQKGQVLAEIDIIPYRDKVALAQSKVEEAEAELRRQEADLARVKEEVPIQIEIARRTLAAAQADEAKAKEALKLTTDEVEKGVLEAQAGLELAQADLVLAGQEYQRFTTLYQARRGVPAAFSGSDTSARCSPSGEERSGSEARKGPGRPDGDRRGPADVGSGGENDPEGPQRCGLGGNRGAIRSRKPNC